MPVYVVEPYTPEGLRQNFGTAWQGPVGRPLQIGPREQFAIPGVRVDPEIMGGTPCVEGTRIPVFVILEMLEGGSTSEEIYRNFPRITRPEQIDAARRYGELHPARLHPEMYGPARS